MKATGMSEGTGNKPAYVTALETIYGPPSQTGFGSAVFYEVIKSGDDLSQAALAKYKYFVGELWSRFGEKAWMTSWKQVYARQSGARQEILTELRRISDSAAKLSVQMILDVVEEKEKGRAALAVVYDDPAMTELRVFNLGDGEAMSGLLIAGRRGDSGEAVYLVFLMD